MSGEQQYPQAHLFSQIDVSQQSSAPNLAGAMADLCLLMRQMIAGQDRQNELLEELVNQFTAAQRQKATELGLWKQANPELSKNCRAAAEALVQVQTEYLTTLTEETLDSYETLRDGEFMMNEFVDRFGPRMAHLNGILQVLGQLGSNTPPQPPKAK